MSVPIVCSECGRGLFVYVTDALARCTRCESEVTPRDLCQHLESGESVRYVGTVLHVVTD